MMEHKIISVAFMAVGAAILAFTAYCIWGAKQVPFRPFFAWPVFGRRDKNPIYFWTVISCYVTMGFVCIFIAASIFFNKVQSVK